MQKVKILKRNLDNELLQYLRTIDSKITYDDLSPDIVSDIKNIMASEESQRYVKYNDEELRRRIEFLEDNKVSISDAIDEEFVDRKLEIIMSNVDAQVNKGMNNYVKNESNSITEYLLSKDLQAKINARYNNNRVYSSIADGDSNISEESLEQIQNRINEIEYTVTKNSNNISQNKNDIDSNLAKINNAIQESSTNTRSIGSINTSLGEIRNSITSLSNYVNQECLLSSNLISFYQLDSELQNKFERIRYNNIKISLSDLDNNLVELIQNGNNNSSDNNGISVEELFNGQNGQIYFTKEASDGTKTLEPNYVFDNDVVVVFGEENLEAGKTIVRERNSKTLCDVGGGTVYSYNSSNDTFVLQTKTINDVLSGKFFVLQPEMSLSYFDQEQGFVELVNLNLKLEDTYATKEGYGVIRQEIQDSANNLSTTIDSLSSSVSQQQIEINGNKNNISGLQTTLSQQQTEINGNKSNISNLQTEINNNKKDVSELQKTLSQLQSTVTQLQSTLNQQQTTITQLQKRVTTLEKNEK